MEGPFDPPGRSRVKFELRLLFNLKPKEMAKMRLLAIWIGQR